MLLEWTKEAVSFLELDTENAPGDYFQRSQYPSQIYQLK